MWKQCLTKNDFDVYLSILQSNIAYKDYTLENIQAFRGRKGGVFYIYDGGTFQITVSFKYNETLRKWRVVHNIPTGNYESLEVAKITFRKIREFMDDHNCRNFYAYLNEKYTPKKLQDVFDAYPQITWEMVSEDVINGTRCWEWYRDPKRINEDELWRT